MELYTLRRVLSQNGRNNCRQGEFTVDVRHKNDGNGANFLVSVASDRGKVPVRSVRDVSVCYSRG